MTLTQISRPQGKLWLAAIKPPMYSVAIMPILVGDKVGEGVFGVSFKMKGLPGDVKTTVNPVKTLTPRFITRALEKMK